MDKTTDELVQEHRLILADRRIKALEEALFMEQAKVYKLKMIVHRCRAVAGYNVRKSSPQHPWDERNRALQEIIDETSKWNG